MEGAEGLYDITNHQHGHVSRHQSSLSDDSGCDLMDDSLTDMQWLQRMDAGDCYSLEACPLRILSLFLFPLPPPPLMGMAI